MSPILIPFSIFYPPGRGGGGGCEAGHEVVIAPPSPGRGNPALFVARDCLLPSKPSLTHRFDGFRISLLFPPPVL